MRLTSASARSFQVEAVGEEVAVAWRPRDGAEAPAMHLLVAAVDAHAVLRVTRADGPGPLAARISTRDATHVVVTVVDGRDAGTGRYGRLCLAATPGEDACAAPGLESPAEEEGCHAAPGALWAPLALLVWLRRRAARPQPSTPRA